MVRLIGIVFLCFNCIAMAAENYPVPSPEKEKIVFNRRDKYPAGINLYAIGPIGFVGLSFDYFITQKFNLEGGAGIRSFENSPGFTVGAKYHFFGKLPLNLTPYVGIFTAFEPAGTTIRNYNMYIPFGLHRIKRDRFSWGVEVAFQYNAYQPERLIWGGFKMGYRFGFKKKGWFRK